MNVVQPAMAEPKIVRIADGVWAQEEDRSVPLPRHLDLHEGRVTACRCTPLIEALEDIRVLNQVPILGARLDCRDQHELVPWIVGRYHTLTPDPRAFRLTHAIALDLRLSVCRFCGMVEVRDVSITSIVETDAEGRRFHITKPGSRVRKDGVLGWYAGRRQRGRAYR